MVPTKDSKGEQCQLYFNLNYRIPDAQIIFQNSGQFFDASD